MKLHPQLQKLFLASLIILLSNAVFSQDKKLETIALKKNVIYGNVSVGNHFSKAVYYERMLKQDMWDSSPKSFVKLGIGRRSSPNGDYGDFVTTQFGLLIGKRSHYLEIAAGFKYHYSGDFEKDILFASVFGWRYQKPGGLLVFRIGTGYPEYIYLGLGISF